MIRNALLNMVKDTVHIKRNTSVSIILITIAFIMLMRVFPQGAVQNHSYSKQSAFNISAMDELKGDEFTVNDKKLQTVWFSKEHLYSVRLYMVCSVPDKNDRSDFVLFRLYDENFSCIYEEQCACGDIEDRGYLEATPDMDVETDKAYYYEMLVPEDCGGTFELPVADRGMLAQTENSTLYIDGIINDDVSLIADFDYSKKLSVFGVILYYILILAAAAVVYTGIAVVMYCYDNHFTYDKELLYRYLRIAASVSVACFAIFLFIFSVVKNRFGGGAADRIFFSIAIIAGTAWLMFAIWLRDRYPVVSKKTKLSADRKLSLIWRNYIQTVSFGLLFYALCQYVNADREYYHYTNTRRMLIFMAIALLMTYSEKHFLNKFSAVWTGASVIGSVIYCNGFEPETNEMELAALTCGVVIFWGLLLINIILNIKTVFKNGFSISSLKNKKTVYGLLWLIFALTMYICRFEKTWVFTATLPFAAMLFINLSPAAKSRLLKNLTNGILLSFGLVVMYCFIHRPHHYWMLYRYGGIFHTVACTGMYLAVVFGAAVGKLFGRLKNKENILLACPFECFLVSAAAGYIILTMSRTAYLAAAVTVMLAAVLAAAAFHKGIKKMVRELCVLLVLVVLCFPLVFSAVRMIPAVINEPVRYDIEHQDRGFMIYRGDPIDSDKYMTVQRFFSTLFGRFQKEESVSEEEEAFNTLSDEKQYLAYTGADLAGLWLKSVRDDSDESQEEESDVSNGRFNIFMDYMKELSFSGHKNMALVNEDGKEHVHAHNSYLQVAYNFGIIAGAAFLIICAVSLWCSIKLVLTQGERFGIYMVPFTLIIVFGIISVTEWAFHPCIPAGFCFLFMQPLLIKHENKQ